MIQTIERHAHASSLLRSAKRFASLFLLCMASAQGVSAQPAVDVALAGLAYSGSDSTIEQRFPYSKLYEKEQQQAGTPIGQQLLRLMSAAPPRNFRIVPRLDELKGRSQALTAALVIGSETVSAEQFGPKHKLTVLIRGQAMFFDFKSMNVVRSYPISFAYIDALDHAPQPEEIFARVKRVYQGVDGKPGLLARFAANVAQAEIPAHVPRFLQVASVRVAPEALDTLPAYIKSEPGAAETWAADMVGEAVSTRAGVPILPYAKGYAIGKVMSMSISDGTVFELKLPTPDYEITVELSGFKKVKFSEVQGGATSFVYGAYAQMRIEEPLSRKTYLNTALKNGESRVIPASQQHVDDFQHYYAAVNGLFVKTAQVIGGKGDEKWLKSAASAKDLETQISQTRELIQQCK